jgi:hypothetical protein
MAEKLTAEGAHEGAETHATVLVEPDRMGVFESKLVRLNKKASQFGLEPIVVTKVQCVPFRRHLETIGRDGDRLLSSLVEVRSGERGRAGDAVLMNRVSLRYAIVKLGAWQVVGKVEAVEGGCLVFCVTAVAEDASEVRGRSQSKLVCEHCKRERNRAGVFVLREEGSGRYMQVGSGCLKDFTGIDPGAAMFLARLQEVVRLAEDEADEFARSSRRNAVATVYFLADVSFLSDRGGFVSSARAQEQGVEPTYSEASRMWSLLERDDDIRGAYRATIERHQEEAQRVRAWVLTKEGETDFDANTKLLLARDYLQMKPRYLALAAATVAMHRKANSEAKRRSEPSARVGVVGEKRVAVLTVERVVELDNPYSRSPTFLVLLRDEEGNKLAWRSAAVPRELVEGKGRRVEAGFKVKRHGEYKGSAQTDVTHLQVKGWREPLPH